MRKAVEAWKQKRSAYYDMYTLILLTHYGIYFRHELAYTFPFFFFFKLKPNICGNPLAFLWLFDLQLLSELYSDVHQSRLKTNKIKLNQDMDHISAFTRPIIPSCLHTTYVNLMIRRRVNTDLPPLKSGEHKINSIERTTKLNLKINNLHVIYMTLCVMRQWFDG